MPSTTCYETNSIYFFSKNLAKIWVQSKFWQTIICFFDCWRPSIFTNYLSLCILLKIFETKKHFWGPSLSTQTSIPAFKSLQRWRSYFCHNFENTYQNFFEVNWISFLGNQDELSFEFLWCQHCFWENISAFF